MAALPSTWFLCFLLSSIIEVVVYFHEFHQKPTTLDGDGIVISTAHLMSEQWHVAMAILGCIFNHSRSIYFKKFSGGACPRTPLGRLRLRRALKMPSAFYLASPIAKMLRGPCHQ